MGIFFLIRINHKGIFIKFQRKSGKIRKNLRKFLKDVVRIFETFDENSTKIFEKVKQLWKNCEKRVQVLIFKKSLRSYKEI